MDEMEKYVMWLCVTEASLIILKKYHKKRELLDYDAFLSELCKSELCKNLSENAIIDMIRIAPGYFNNFEPEYGG